MNDTTDQQTPTLPGYTLSTRLGAGGYGEVWLAHAPGGLTKAVKFVYGSFHEKRAEHELKALQRMKDLRHPFLLSLERIEVVEGRLVIVTELAESSLKDQFDKCQREGLPGIPREELLQYLEDAADALDFLSEKHSLQHLDVKPENLLLVAGHVKVADFGLVKDIGNTQASMVGGLTPLYSAPEVFQGNPSARSDQYSLAVLYQEMLSGALPFPGVTAAELTLQHLHDEPDMSPLPIADRYVLARALSKDPANRFETCSEFIRALVAAQNDGGAWSATPAEDVRTTPGFDSSPSERAQRRAGPATEFFDEQIDQPRKELSPSMLLDWEPPADTPPRALEAIDLSAAEFTARPTVVIGIGGTAATMLKQLRLRLARQFGDEPLPAVQMLLLDSDPKTIAQAMQGDARTALQPEETLALPLRRPQEYREQSARLMRWLSRRWLYNIPKSLRTEGLRPLGRLALADHARQAVQRIRMAIAKATDAESLDASSKQTGLAFQSGVRVYIVASISGGAGSGMSLDIGYAVRTALEKAGVADAQIVGLFVHAAGRDAKQCDLACVNTYAWLTEYNHFHQPGGQFPGDESCGLPPLTANKRAFDSAYLIDVGAEIEPSEFEEAARSVAEYVYLDGFTKAQRFFEGCRQDANSTLSSGAPLRTLALRRILAAADASVETAAAHIAREVVLKWSGRGEHPLQRCGPPAPSDTGQLVQGAAKLVGHLQLRLEGLASNARGLIEAQFGGDQQAFLDNLMQLSTEDASSAGPVEMVRIVDCLFAVPQDQPEGRYILQRPLDGIVSPLTMRLAGDLAKWVLQKLDDRQQRLAGAQGAAQWLVDHLTNLEADAARLSTALLKQIAACADDLQRQAAAPASEAAWQQAISYFRMRTDHQAVLASSLIARRLLAEVTTVSTTVMEFGRHVKHLAMNMPSPVRNKATADAFMEAVNQRLPALADAVDEQMQAEFIAAGGGLFQTIMGNSRVRAQMLSELLKRARQVAEQLAAQPDIVQNTLAGSGGAEAADAAEPTLPRLLGRGGAYRGLAVLPQHAGAASSKLVASELGPSASVLAGVGNDVVLCLEGWDLPLASVAVDVIQSRRDYADFASRVLTRSDVAWTPLTAPRATFAPVAGDSAFADAMPMMTQVL